jgi:branched-chain amino acid transport system permease protein
MTAVSADAQPPAPFQKRPPADSGGSKWAVGFLIAAAVIFIFYQYAYQHTSPDFQNFVRGWLPITSVNESLIYVIMALGLNIVVGYAGLLDLGYVAFWAIGGYTAGWLMSSFIFAGKFHFLGTSASNVRGIHITFWVVLAIAGLFCALLGIIIGAPTLRLKSDYLAIVTLGFGEIVTQFFYNSDNVFGGHNIANGTRGILPIDPVGTGVAQVLPGVPKSLGPFDGPYRFLIFCGLAALCVFVSLRLRTGRLGRAWLAIREDELAASMMGVPLMRTKLASYAVGAFFGGLGGVAFATHINGVIADRFNFSISASILAMVVLGGMGNVWGVILGALVLSWINSTGLVQFGSSFNSSFGTSIDWSSKTFLMYGGLLVLMMLFRREGLIPEARTRQVLREPERGELESIGADMEGDEIMSPTATPGRRKRWGKS